MSVSLGSGAWSVASPLWLAAAAVLAYAAAAWPAAAHAGAAIARPRWPVVALTAGWMLHLVVLLLDIGGWGTSQPGTRLGFAPVLSMTVWLVLAVYTVENRLAPPQTARRVLAVTGAAAVALAWSFPGESRPLSNPWAPLHFALGVASYGLFGAAVLHAALLDMAERRMRLRTGAGAGGGLDGGMPLLQLERLTFRFVEAGFAVLTATLLLGVLTSTHWAWDHKTVFSLLGWAVFAALLVGRRLHGWRGRRATRWLYAGALLLLLAYAGSRFVLEVVLERGA